MRKRFRIRLIPTHLPLRPAQPFLGLRRQHINFRPPPRLGSSCGAAACLHSPPPLISPPRYPCWLSHRRRAPVTYVHPADSGQSSAAVSRLHATPEPRRTIHQLAHIQMPPATTNARAQLVPIHLLTSLIHVYACVWSMHTSSWLVLCPPFAPPYEPSSTIAFPCRSAPHRHVKKSARSVLPRRRSDLS